jgi:hypothetical protein
MAKESPWFKFYPDSWLGGDIQYCTDKSKVFFINLCCYLWKNEAVLKIDSKSIRRLTGDQQTFNTCLTDLKEWGIIDVNEKRQEITVKFITQLYNKRENEKKAKSLAGKTSAKKRWGKKLDAVTEAIAPVKQELQSCCNTTLTEGVTENNNIELEVDKEKINKKEKLKFGEGETVRLTQDEYQKLLNGWRAGKGFQTEANLQLGITKLDTYLRQTGKKYKSHYAVMQDWVHDQIMGKLTLFEDGMRVEDGYSITPRMQQIMTQSGCTAREAYQATGGK